MLPHTGVYVHQSFRKWIKAYLCCHIVCLPTIQLLFLPMSVLCTCPQFGAWSRPWAEGVCFLMLGSADRSELRMGQGASRYPLPEMNKQNGFDIMCQNKVCNNLRLLLSSKWVYKGHFLLDLITSIIFGEKNNYEVAHYMMIFVVKNKEMFDSNNLQYEINTRQLLYW
jgi:hypothetical protein